MNLLKRFILIFIIISAGCTSSPDGVEPVSDFDVNRYLGKWYEIARLDHGFERDLVNVTAEYQLREDGGIVVINRGFNEKQNQWDEVIGKAYFVISPEIGQLKVSFFGPFYGGYTIIELDEENYEYSLVSGPNRNYLWILARSPDLAQSTIDELVAIAKSLKFPTEELIYLYSDNNP